MNDRASLQIYLNSLKLFSIIFFIIRLRPNFSISVKFPNPTAHSLYYLFIQNIPLNFAARILRCHQHKIFFNIEDKGRAAYRLSLIYNLLYCNGIGDDEALYYRASAKYSGEKGAVGGDFFNNNIPISRSFYIYFYVIDAALSDRSRLKV